jgi:hypothetical protein
MAARSTSSPTLGVSAKAPIQASHYSPDVRARANAPLDIEWERAITAQFPNLKRHFVSSCRQEEIALKAAYSRLENIVIWIREKSKLEEDSSWEMTLIPFKIRFTQDATYSFNYAHLVALEALRQAEQN